jgi:hypothetical protein
MNNTPNSLNITLFLLICSIVVIKFGFERLSDFGVWLVNLLCACAPPDLHKQAAQLTSNMTSTSKPH